MGQKFVRRNPEKQWTLERTYQRKTLVDQDIADTNRTINQLTKLVKHLVEHVRPNLCKKVSRKCKYRKQLEDQIVEIKNKPTPE